VTAAGKPGTAGLGRMFSAGSRALWRHRWVVLGVYLVSLALSAVVGTAAMLAATAAFGSFPAFEHAMNGDAAAFIGVLSRGDRGVWVTIFLFTLGVGSAYAVLSWFLRGGLIAVFLEDPASNRARVFGAGGAATLAAYFRLWLLSLVPMVPVLIVLGVGTTANRDAMSYAVTFDAYFAALMRGVGPAFALGLVVLTASDYARVEISRHSELGAVRGFVRGWRIVATSWQPMVHSALLTLLGFGALYVYFSATDGWHPTATGAVLALFAARQGALATRFACSVSKIAGQVEHARSR